MRSYPQIALNRLASALVAVLLVVAVATAANACPTCAEGVAQNDPHGQSIAAGYYYSILFMMSMPYLLLTTLGTCAYRLVKKAQTQQAARSNEATS
jgi:hypothetical protein